MKKERDGKSTREFILCKLRIVLTYLRNYNFRTMLDNVGICWNPHTKIVINAAAVVAVVVVGAAHRRDNELRMRGIRRDSSLAFEGSRAPAQWCVCVGGGGGGT